MTPHAVSNPHEEIARQKKASALADRIATMFPAEFLDGALSEHVLASMSNEWWEAVAREAGTNPPSPTTISVVVEILERRSAYRREVASDPLAGLPQ